MTMLNLTRGIVVQRCSLCRELQPRAGCYLNPFGHQRWLCLDIPACLRRFLGRETQP